MKLAGSRMASAMIFTLCLAAGAAGAQTAGGQAGSAERLFAAGRFAEAGSLALVDAKRDPADAGAAILLGRVALLANRLEEARGWLAKAIALEPGDADAKVMLAEALYRADDFPAAAAALAGVDVANNELVKSQYPTLNVAKMASFKGQRPYAIEGEGAVTRLRFVRSEPLPLVRVRVNGGQEVDFFIDTGGSEVTLDTQFARELGMPDFGAVEGTFSGGQKAAVRQGRIDSLTLGGWTVRDLPAVALPLRQLSEGLGVKRIDGIIGTTLLYHFLATLDYPKGELVLRRKSASGAAPAATPSDGGISVPIWMASDHFMIGWGRVESLPPTLLFVDTGLAGAGVKLAQPVIAAAGIKLDTTKAAQGAGGAGTLTITPYVVRRLSLGDLREDNVAGLYDGPFPWESRFGFPWRGWSATSSSAATR